MLTIMVGPPASGKSSYARRHFPAEQIVSFDALSGVVSGKSYLSHLDTKHVLQTRVLMRCLEAKPSVVDATNLTQADRLLWVDLARDFGLPIHAIVLTTPLAAVLARDALRPCPLDPELLHACHAKLARTLFTIRSEGFDAVTLVLGIGQ